MSQYPYKMLFTEFYDSTIAGLLVGIKLFA